MLESIVCSESRWAPLIEGVGAQRTNGLNARRQPVVRIPVTKCPTIKKAPIRKGQSERHPASETASQTSELASSLRNGRERAIIYWKLPCRRKNIHRNCNCILVCNARGVTGYRIGGNCFPVTRRRFPGAGAVATDPGGTSR